MRGGGHAWRARVDDRCARGEDGASHLGGSEGECGGELLVAGVAQHGDLVKVGGDGAMHDAGVVGVIGVIVGCNGLDLGGQAHEGCLESYHVCVVQLSVVVSARGGRLSSGEDSNITACDMGRPDAYIGPRCNLRV